MDKCFFSIKVFFDHGEDIEVFTVLKHSLLGQYYSIDDQKIGTPDLAWACWEMRNFYSLKEATAFIDGLTALSDLDIVDTARHPTRVSSEGGPGFHKLADSAYYGPLLFKLKGDEVIDL